MDHHEPNRLERGAGDVKRDAKKVSWNVAKSGTIDYHKTELFFIQDPLCRVFGLLLVSTIADPPWSMTKV